MSCTWSSEGEELRGGVYILQQWYEIKVLDPIEIAGANHSTAMLANQVVEQGGVGVSVLLNPLKTKDYNILSVCVCERVCVCVCVCECACSRVSTLYVVWFVHVHVHVCACH